MIILILKVREKNHITANNQVIGHPKIMCGKVLYVEITSSHLN